MTWIRQTIESFGQSLGIEDLAFSKAGILSLDFERRGTFFLELDKQEQVLAYLVRRVPTYASGIPARALAVCHFEEAHPFPVCPAWRGEQQLVFLAHIPIRDCSLPILERLLELLTQCQDRALMGAPS